MSYFYLSFAIVCEVIATTALKASEGFTRVWPSIIVAVGYGLSFYALSRCLKTMSIGVVYAVWSGLGIVLITLAGFVVYKQKLDTPAIIGMSLVVIGVCVIQLFSKTVSA